MSAIKISSKVEETVWNELREHARESKQSVSGLLTEAIAAYLARRRVRPTVLSSGDKPSSSPGGRAVRSPFP